MKNCVNLACGSVYLNDWLNIDYVPHSSAVKKANLLKQLPIADKEVNVVYSSHFLEHIPHELVSDFLAECYRITQIGGYIRLVLPDWEEMCSTYLAYRKKNQHKKADFLMIAMLDQCVRREVGGQLGAYYNRLKSDPSKHKEMIEFVEKRTGQDLSQNKNSDKKNYLFNIIRNPKKVFNKAERLYIRTVLALLPTSFRQSNVSLTDTGEKHAWMYDFYSVKKYLLNAGFNDVQKMSASTSSINEFPFFPLDLKENGEPRKGIHSMYIEAVKR